MKQHANIAPAAECHAALSRRAVGGGGAAHPRAGALRLTAACLTAVLLLSGCSLLSSRTYAPPQAQVPAQWQADGDRQDAALSVSSGQWWRHFDDPVLDALVDQALTVNADLAVAALRVRRAQLQAGLAQDALVPSLSLGADASRQRNLRGDRVTSGSYSVSGAVRWETDLWGKLGSQRDAAQWTALATEQDRQAAALALTGTVMTLYWKGGLLAERIAAGRLSVDTAQRTLALVQGQHQAGAVSGLEVAEAETRLASQQSGLRALEQEQAETRNAMAILFDGPPSQDSTMAARLPQTALPAVQAGVPAQLLGRRPDLRAAQLRLRSTLASGNAVRAGYYPSLTLTGSLGSVSTALANVLQNPVAALGAGIALPFLQWNQMRLDIAVTDTEYEEAVVSFRQTLYQAMADVENALSARQALAAQGALLDQSLQAARRSEQLYEARYRAGAVALRAWLDAQETRRQAEIAVSQNRYDQFVNQVTLYQALGGDDATPSAEQ